MIPRLRPLGTRVIYQFIKTHLSRLTPALGFHVALSTGLLISFPKSQWWKDVAGILPAISQETWSWKLFRSYSSNELGKRASSTHFKYWIQTAKKHSKEQFVFHHSPLNFKTWLYFSLTFPTWSKVLVPTQHPFPLLSGTCIISACPLTLFPNLCFPFSFPSS